MKVWALGLLFSLATGCATDRFVGSIGRDRVYGNRGYGLTLDLSFDDLEARFQVLDPHTLKIFPRRDRPAEIFGPLDQNGDGILGQDERVHYQLPTLRLISRTSSTARIDLDVTVLGGRQRLTLLEGLLRAAAEDLVGTSSAAGQPSVHAPVAGYGAQVVQVTGRSSRGEPRVFRVVGIDHADFEVAEGRTRRQLVLVILSAQMIDDRLIAEQERVLAALLLSSEAGELSSRERW